MAMILHWLQMILSDQWSREIPHRCRTLIYIATWPKEVRKIATNLLARPVQVNNGSINELVANKAITQILQRQGTKIGKVLNFVSDEAILEERITGRWIHPFSGRTYQSKFAPPKVPGIYDIIGYAPGFPHGVIDPIEELGQLALIYGVCFHVDLCLGGFVLPFARKLGYILYRAFGHVISETPLAAVVADSKKAIACKQ